MLRVNVKIRIQLPEVKYVVMYMSILTLYTVNQLNTQQAKWFLHHHLSSIVIRTDNKLTTS